MGPRNWLTTLKMKVLRSFESSGTNYLNTGRNNPAPYSRAFSAFKNYLSTLNFYCKWKVQTLLNIFFLSWRNNPLVGLGLLVHEVFVFLDHTRHTTVSRTPLDEWSACHRDLYLTTQHSQQTDIHALGGIRTHDLSRRAAVDLSLRLHSHWDQHYGTYYTTLFQVQWFHDNDYDDNTSQLS